MLAVTPSIGLALSDPVGGAAWYRGAVDLSLEPQLLFNFEQAGSGAGLALYLRYQFLGRGRLVPFVGVGGARGADLVLRLRAHASHGCSRHFAPSHLRRTL